MNKRRLDPAALEKGKAIVRKLVEQDETGSSFLSRKVASVTIRQVADATLDTLGVYSWGKGGNIVKRIAGEVAGTLVGDAVKAVSESDMLAAKLGGVMDDKARSLMNTSKGGNKITVRVKGQP